MGIFSLGKMLGRTTRGVRLTLVGLLFLLPLSVEARAKVPSDVDFALSNIFARFLYAFNDGTSDEQNSAINTLQTEMVIVFGLLNEHSVAPLIGDESAVEIFSEDRIPLGLSTDDLAAVPLSPAQEKSHEVFTRQFSRSELAAILGAIEEKARRNLPDTGLVEAIKRNIVGETQTILARATANRAGFFSLRMPRIKFHHVSVTAKYLLIHAGIPVGLGVAVGGAFAANAHHLGSLTPRSFFIPFGITAATVKAVSLVHRCGWWLTKDL